MWRVFWRFVISDRVAGATGVEKLLRLSRQHDSFVSIRAYLPINAISSQAGTIFTHETACGDDQGDAGNGTGFYQECL